MTATKKDPVLVVLQMSGAFDALNTIIPYSDPLYKDYRPHLKVEPEEVLAIDDKVGFHPAMAPIKDLYDEGKVAVIQGIGYPNPIRSHFRSMDIWHTAEPTKMSTEGWLGRAIQDLGPQQGKRADRRELRSRSPPRAGRSRRVRRLGGQAGNLRRPHRH